MNATKLDTLAAHALIWGGLAFAITSIYTGCSTLQKAADASDRIGEFLRENQESTARILGELSTVAGRAGADYDAVIAKIQAALGNVQEVTGKIPELWESVRDMGHELKSKIGSSTALTGGGGLLAAIVGRNWLSAKEKGKRFGDLERETMSANATAKAALEALSKS